MHCKAGATRIFFSIFFSCSMLHWKKMEKKIGVAWQFWIFFCVKKREKKLKITQFLMQQNRTFNDLIGKLHASPRFNCCYNRITTDLKKWPVQPFCFFNGRLHWQKFHFFSMQQIARKKNEKKNSCSPSLTKSKICLIVISQSQTFLALHQVVKDHFKAVLCALTLTKNCASRGICICDNL